MARNMSPTTLRLWLLLDILGPMTKQRLMQLTGIDVETMSARLSNLRRAAFIALMPMELGALLPAWTVTESRPRGAEEPNAHEFVREIVDLITTPLAIRKYFESEGAIADTQLRREADELDDAMACMPTPRHHALSVQSRPLLTPFYGARQVESAPRRPGSQDFRAIPSREGDRRALRSLDAPAAL